MHVVWMPVAKNARIAALRHTAQTSPKAALDQFNEIRRQTRLLRTHPYIGRPGRAAGTREFVLARTPFILIYRVRLRAGRIEILRFLHTAQKWPRRPA